MCHTPSSVTRDAIEAGGGWRCVRCGQHWDATRLAAVATCAAWAADREGRQLTEGSHDAAKFDSPAERLGRTS